MPYRNSAVRTKRKNSVFHKCYQPTYCWQILTFSQYILILLSIATTFANIDVSQ